MSIRNEYMKLLHIALLTFPLLFFVGIETYRMMKIIGMVEMALKNMTKTPQNTRHEYVECMNGCIRRMTEKHGPIDDYSGCIKICGYTKQIKKVDILTNFTYMPLQRYLSYYDV